MPWVTRGLGDGTLTTRWPAGRDEYFDQFTGAVEVVGRPRSDGSAAGIAPAVDTCPTGAISAGADGLVSIDRGRCILCGRCVAASPEAFAWRPGSAVAHTDRDALVVTAIEETDEAVEGVRAALRERVRWLRRSVHVRHLDAGSDGAEEWEVQALTNPVYDIHRLGIFFTASPRHADLLLVTGIGTAGMHEAVRATLEAMPTPTVVVAAGADAVSGGLMGRGYTSGTGVGDLLDVDVWVPGSPPSPFSILHGILLALGRVGPPGVDSTRRRGR